MLHNKINNTFNSGRAYLIALTMSFCLLLLTVPVKAENKGEITVQDLRYGEILFYYYQDKYFSAITRLMQTKKYNPITEQGQTPDVLLGGLFLGYGLRDDAISLFNNILKQNTSQLTQDQAWYYLGKSWYRIQDFENALASLNKVSERLPEDRMNERYHLLANIFQKQGKFEQAKKMLNEINDDAIWKQYTNYNLGSALIKSGKFIQGQELLDEVGDIKAETEELASLRDRANLALGFSYIQKNNTYKALSYLRKVRLYGPHSNKALLGLGWAHSLLKQHTQSLIPWYEVAQRSALDPSVQESLLAIAWANDEAGQTKQALADYEKAITILSQEKEKLDVVINKIKAGELEKILNPQTHDLEIIVPLEIKRTTSSSTLPYLSRLLASQTFQSAYKDYRDLFYLRSILNKWQRQLPTLQNMLVERIESYNNKLEQVSTDPRLKLLKEHQTKRKTLQNRFEVITATEDALALANEKEKAQLKTLAKIKQQLGTLNDSTLYREQIEKYQRLYGILYWNISTDYAPRAWKIKRQLRELDSALEKTQNAEKSLANTWNTAPRYFSQHARKLKQHQQKLNMLSSDINTLLKKQSNYLYQLALSELTQRQQALNDYQIRAQYNLSLLIDKLSSTTIAQKQVSP